jgi:outer membrane receptor protein involved in Fe transport
MARMAAIFFALSLLAAPVVAQIPTSGNVFFGYSYDNTNFSNIGRANLNGFEGSLEGKIFPGIGIVADFSTSYGSQIFNTGAGTCAIGATCTGKENLHLYQALFGPRFSASLGKYRPFAEFEFGLAHLTAGAPASDSSFATALGGGLDYRIIRPIAWRFQGDYVSTHLFGTYQNGVRLSTGIVIRF